MGSFYLDIKVKGKAREQITHNNYVTKVLIQTMYEEGKNLG